MLLGFLRDVYNHVKYRHVRQELKRAQTTRRSGSGRKKYSNISHKPQGTLESTKDWFFRRGEAATKNLPNYDNKLDFFGEFGTKKKKQIPTRRNITININVSDPSTKRRKKKRRK